MTATQSIKTPVMTLPIRPGQGTQEANELANRLRRIRLAEVRTCSNLMSHVLLPKTRTDGVSKARSVGIEVTFQSPNAASVTKQGLTEHSMLHQGGVTDTCDCCCLQHAGLFAVEPAQLC